MHAATIERFLVEYTDGLNDVTIIDAVTNRRTTINLYHYRQVRKALDELFEDADTRDGTDAVAPYKQ